MKKKECYISLAHIICSLAVVMIHTNECFREFNIARCWTSANIIDCGLGFAVPVFLMITGATLMDYRERYSTKQYFVNRIKKTLVPFIVWSIVGILYGAKTGHNGTFFIYYFFINLFGIYLCIPLFGFLNENYKEKLILCLVIIFFVINYFLPFVCNVPYEIGDNYIIYALIGYLISKRDISLIGQFISYLGSIIGFGLHIGGTYIASVNIGYIVDTYRGYANLPCLLSAIGVFVLIKQIGSNIKNEKIISVIEWGSGYTFSVYLLHYYVINSVILRFVTNTHSLFYRLGSPIFTFALCVILAYGFRKIPLLRRILP